MTRPALEGIEGGDSAEAREGEVVAAEPKHVLVVGDKEFVCGNQLPLSTLIRYANDGLLSMHHILARLVPEDQHEEMWDAFETLDEDEVGEAISRLVESYSDRPTQRPNSSSPRSKRTRR